MTTGCADHRRSAGAIYARFFALTLHSKILSIGVPNVSKKWDRRDCIG